MSVKVNILENGKGVEIIATGVVTGDEIIKVQPLRYDKTILKKQRYQIIDKSQCTEYAVSHKDIEKIAQFDREAAKVNPNIIIAIIESESLHFSLTPLWQAHIKDSVLMTRSFIHRNNALDWISENLRQK